MSENEERLMTKWTRKDHINGDWIISIVIYPEVLLHISFTINCLLQGGNYLEICRQRLPLSRHMWCTQDQGGFSRLTIHAHITSISKQVINKGNLPGAHGAKLVKFHDCTADEVDYRYCYSHYYALFLRSAWNESTQGCSFLSDRIFKLSNSWWIIMKFRTGEFHNKISK